MNETPKKPDQPVRVSEPMTEEQAKRYRELFADWKLKNPGKMMPPQQQVYLQEKARIEQPNIG